MPASTQPDLALVLPSIPKFTVDSTGLDIRETLTTDDFAAICDRAGHAAGACAWIIGDLLVYGERGWGQGTLFEGVPQADRTSPAFYVKMAALTGVDISTLQHWAYVSRRVPKELRSPHVSHKAHAKVARLVRDEDKRKWIGVAEKHALAKTPLSGRRLARSIVAGRLVSAKELAADRDKGVDCINIHVERIRAFTRELENDGWFDSASPEMAAGMLRDLAPIFTLRTRLEHIVNQGRLV